MTTDRYGTDAQGNRIDRGELFGRPIAPGDELAIFFHVGGYLIRRRIIRTDLRLARDDNDIASGPIPIKIEGHSGVLLQMRQSFGI